MVCKVGYAGNSMAQVGLDEVQEVMLPSAQRLAVEGRSWLVWNIYETL
jgi:hypothetical protein